MVDNEKMTPAQSPEIQPVTQTEFHTAVASIDQRLTLSQERFEASQEEFRAAMKKIDRRFTDIDQRFEESHAEFQSAMQRVDRRFVQLEARIEDVKTHAGILHEDLVHRFDLVFEYLAPFPDKLANHEERLVTAEGEIDTLKTFLRPQR